MAEYKDLFALRSNSELHNRLTVAAIVAAEEIRNEDGGTDNHVNRLLWAAAVFQDPQRESKRLFWSLLAANKDATIENIIGSSDATLQTAVDDAVDLFAG